MCFNECKIRIKIININNNEPVFYPFSIKRNKCSGSCTNINMNMLNCEFLMLLKYKFQSIQSNVMELSDKPHRMARNL